MVERKLAVIAEFTGHRMSGCVDATEWVATGMEIAESEVGAALIMARHHAGKLMGLGVVLRDRLPRVRAAVARGQLDLYRVGLIESATRNVTPEHLGEVERHVLDQVLAPSDTPGGGLTGRRLSNIIGRIVGHLFGGVRRTSVCGGSPIIEIAGPGTAVPMAPGTDSDALRRVASSVPHSNTCSSTLRVVRPRLSPTGGLVHSRGRTPGNVGPRSYRCHRPEQRTDEEMTTMAQAPDREKALDLALAQIDKNFGKGSVMRLGDETRVPIAVIPTGSIALDVALGIGGLPRGRVVEIYGPESSGKTTVALHAVANAQAAGGIAAFIDAEHALDPDYAQKLGVDTDALLVSQPDTGEQALEIADMLIRSGALDILVIDSVAALVPRAEIEGEMGDSHVGLQARLMSQALRKMTGAMSNSGTTVIFINQLREKIGVMFGSPETTTGGKALKFYASVRLDIRRIETLKDGTDAVGNRTRVKVVKNKVAPPFKQAEFDILYGHGISREGSLIDMGVEHGFVRKSGAWYTYEGDQLGQGKENARKFLLQNPDVGNDIEKKVKEKLGIGAVLTADDVVPAPVDF